MPDRFTTPTIEELTQEYEDDIREYEQYGYPTDKHGKTIPREMIATPEARLNYYNSEEYQQGLRHLNRLSRETQYVDYENKRILWGDDPETWVLADVDDYDPSIDMAKYSDVDISGFADKRKEEPRGQE